MNRLCSTAPIVAAALAGILTPLAVLETAQAQATASCHGHRATMAMGPHQYEALGTNHRDVIVGNGQPNLIRGRGGSDIICGGRRGDRLEGGAGNDQLYGGKSEDTLVGGMGDDVEVTGPPAAEHTNTVLEGAGDDRIVLSAYDHLEYVARPTFTATAPPVDADLGQGTVTGQGDDRLVLPKDRSIAIFVPPGSTVRGTAFRDVIFGSSSSLFGGGGDDDFFAPGSDVHGNAGNDYIASGTTADDHSVAVYGGTGRDAVVSTKVRPGDDVTLDGGPGARDGAGLEVALGAGQTTPFPVVDLDLASHLAVGSSVWSITGFENARLTVDNGVADTISVEGTDGANSLRIHAGLVPISVHALGGDDEVTTGEGDDTVDGGDGTDAADTAGGHDTCFSVEHATNCESVAP